MLDYMKNDSIDKDNNACSVCIEKGRETEKNIVSELNVH